MALSKILCESPPVSHIANPARPADLMYLPFAAIRRHEYDKLKGKKKSESHTERCSIIVGHHYLGRRIVYERLSFKVISN